MDADTLVCLEFSFSLSFVFYILSSSLQVRENVDDLFDREELSAAPDVGWPDCFNSGVFVFRPSLVTYNSLLELACSQGSFDGEQHAKFVSILFLLDIEFLRAGGDQGLLNLYFSDWSTKDISRHLPFVYNCVSTCFYTYQPAIKQLRRSSCMHNVLLRFHCLSGSAAM